MFETQEGTLNRTRDLPKKGSAFILSSDHWTMHAPGRQEAGNIVPARTDRHNPPMVWTLHNA